MEIGNRIRSRRTALGPSQEGLLCFGSALAAWAVCFLLIRLLQIII